MKKYLSYLFGCLLILTSCEPEISENYVDVERPPETIDVRIELTPENAGNVITLIDGGNFQCSITSPGRSTVYCKWTFDTEQWDYYNSHSSFGLYRGGRRDGEYKLTCKAYFSSGTGSIADQIGNPNGDGTIVEGYEMEYTWIVRFVTITEPAPSLTHRITDEGYLELSWKKPELNGIEFKGYNLVYGYNTTVTTIDNPDQTTYVDKNYFGQGGEFNMRVYINDWSHISLGSVYLNNAPINLNFDNSAPDSLAVTWSNGYASMITVNDENGNLLVRKTKEKTFKIPYGVFGENYRYLIVHIFPAGSSVGGEGNSYNQYIDFPASPSVISTQIASLWNVVYNRSSDVIYGVFQDRQYYKHYTKGWQLSDYSEVFSRAENSPERIASSIFDGKIALRYYDRIDILESNNGELLSSIASGNYSFESTPTFLDNRMISAYTADRKMNIYRSPTGRLEHVINLSEHMPNYGFEPFMTSDRKYIYLAHLYEHSFTILRLENYKVTESSNIISYYDGWCQNPLQSEQLFLSADGTIRQYDVSSLAIVNEWKHPGMRIINIDPKTENILLRGDNKIAVIDSHSGEELYSMQVIDYNDYTLYGNILFSTNGYSINIAKHLSK